MSLNRCVPLSGISHFQTHMGFLSILTSIQDHTVSRDDSICKFHFLSTGSVTPVGGGSAYDDFQSIGFISTLAAMHPCMHLYFATFAEEWETLRRKKLWKSGSKKKGFKYSFQHSNEQFTSLQLIALECNKIKKHKQNQNWLALFLPCSQLLFT